VTNAHDIDDALLKYFGHSEFRGGQRGVVEAIVNGQDALAVMPTGGGKSLCYQLPAVILDGVTLVVSPLIALMKDQVDALLEKGIPATLINSSISLGEQKERLRGMRDGSYKLVYLAPERFRSRMFLDSLREINVALFAVDEAHCLSQWGHDFRPDYMRLGAAVKAAGSPTVAAFTATATPEVRDDIRKQLQLKSPLEIVSGFQRENLSLNIPQVGSVATKLDRIVDIVAKWNTGIIYCATRKSVEKVALELKSRSVSIVSYHGGMTDVQRSSAQEKFVSGKVDVAVATNAFGMGIDRSDVRFVVHYEIPGSIEAYYQEAGRAGRDGDPSHCELLFNYADTRTQEFFLDGANPGAGMIRNIYAKLHHYKDEKQEVHLTNEELADHVGAKNSMAISSAVAHLSRAGYIEKFDIPGSRRRGTRLLRPDVSWTKLELNERALEEKDRRDRAKLKSMVELCYGKGCRQEAILNYFGDPTAHACGSCDECRGTSSKNKGGSSGGTREANEREMECVRKALAGVARMSRRNGSQWEGRFGRMKIAAMLAGSKSQDIQKARLNELSTYGILREFGQAYISKLLLSLERSDLLKTEVGEYPLLTLTAKGEDVMRNGTSFKMSWPKVQGGAGEQKPLGDVDAVLLEKLREWRKTKAETKGVPSYVILGNKSLQYLAAEKPTTEPELLGVYGLGEAKVAQFGDDLLHVISTHTT